MENTKISKKITFNQQLTTNNQQLKLGFTLIELLVVISIIAILVTIGLTSFSTAQKKSRDAKRKSDVREIQQAMEQYYSVCGLAYISIAPGSFYSSINCASPAISIMPSVPSDPRGTAYVCPTSGVGTGCSTTEYKICTTLETEATSQYCLTNQQ